MNAEEITLARADATRTLRKKILGQQETAALQIIALYEIALQLAKIAESMPERSGA